MAKPNLWVSHIEAFVDSARPSNQQNASINAIAALVKNDLLTLEGLVREMELYLTTTDHFIRARGTLLLGEVLARLNSKPLVNATVSSLVDFFASRLADWQALRGALVGCLALLRRKSNVGMVIATEPKILTESYLTNVSVQSLAVHDRKLCFEVLKCLLEVHPEAVMTLGDDLIYGILGAIDEEKDPRCLMLTFYIAESLVRLLPYPSSSLKSFAGELFEILGRYFPIYFTHPGNDEFEIKRDDLSRALMNALCSTPYFEPFVIPLLFDKLSSSLPLAKLDSLKYLSNCILQYGPDRMTKHAKTIWSALKDVVFNFSPQGTVISLVSASAGDMESQENQVVEEASICLRMAFSHLNCPNSEPFISLVLVDPDIERIFESVSSKRIYSAISQESQCQLSSLGRILSIACKVSTDCCSHVFQTFFPRLMNALGVSTTASYGSTGDCKTFSESLNFGALYLCIELLASCRDLSTATQDSLLVPNSWWNIFKQFYHPLTYALVSDLNPITDGNTGPEHLSYVVKGLQVLAIFPGFLSPLSEDKFEEILAVLMSVITDRSDDSFLWKLALDALVQIGLYIEKLHDSQKGGSYKKIVVERIVSLISLDDSTTSLELKLEMISKIGIAAPEFMSTINQGIEEAIMSNFSVAWFNGSHRAADILVTLLESYYKMLPWCHKSGKIDEVAIQFATKIWTLIGDSSSASINLKGKAGLLDTTMKTMKLLVGYCTEENQSALVAKAYNILSSTIVTDSLLLPLSKLDAIQSIISYTSGLPYKDEWLVHLFSSVVISLRPETPLPDVEQLIRLLTIFLLKGHISAAHALASMMNKWSSNKRTELSSAYKLEEAIDVILESLSSVLCCPLEKCNVVHSADGTLGCSSLQTFQTHAIVGLAWIGKGLLMRGHDGVKEISMLILKCLLSDLDMFIDTVHLDEPKNGNQHDIHSFLTRSAADAFHVLISDSEVCLNKRFHATARPLYKQRFFSSIMPVFLSSIKEYSSPRTRTALYRALGHVISDTPLLVLVAEAKKVIPPLLEGISILSPEAMNKEMTYSLLLVLCGILMDESGKEAIIENAHVIISHLTTLISYQHMTLVRETAIQCLVAMSALPHTRIYPMRPQVLRALSKSLDDRKRVVRQEAVRCRQAWASIASRTLQF